MGDPGEGRWSSRVDAAAAEHELGAPADWDQANAPQANRRLALTMLFFSIVVLLVGIAFARADQQKSGEWWNASGVLGIGLLMVVLGLVYLLRKGPSQWVVLFERGAVFQQAMRPPVVLRWADVTVQVVRYKVNSTPHEVTVLTDGQRSIRIGELFLRQAALRATALAATTPASN